jgi:S-adenosylmethionine-diacylglycerol 3-amino-3-carboxypropyl transferase
MSDSLPGWVAEAAALPVAFAQVREDALLDQAVVQGLGRDARLLLIASGGCTAALLSVVPNVARLHLVDPNPAQLALTRLKLRLLRTVAPDERLGLLGHRQMPAAERRVRLERELGSLGLARDALGPLDLVARVGPDQAGRYECVFAALRAALDPEREELMALLQLADLAEQQRRVAASTPLGKRIDQAFDTVLALPNLVRLFGPEATKNPLVEFSRHFAQRLRHVLATLPARENPYLWQMLLGSNPPGRAAPWLEEPMPSGPGPQVTCSAVFMAEALAAEPAAYDFVHLSNCLDWLSAEQAQETLLLAWKALRPGGVVFIRQLNSSLQIPALASMFDWDVGEAQRLHARDRSFFYRAQHLGRKA